MNQPHNFEVLDEFMKLVNEDRKILEEADDELAECTRVMADTRSAYIDYRDAQARSLVIKRRVKKAQERRNVARQFDNTIHRMERVMNPRPKHDAVEGPGRTW